jgi:AraC-like DNA-binding protein
MMEGETSRPINVIARECGYSSSWILSRTLKRDAGMTRRPTGESGRRSDDGFSAKRD